MITWHEKCNDKCNVIDCDYMTNVIDYDYLTIWNYDYDYSKFESNRLPLLTHFAITITITQNDHVLFDCYYINSETHW